MKNRYLILAFALVVTLTIPYCAYFRAPPWMYHVPEGEYKGYPDDPRWNWWRSIRWYDKSFEWKMPLEFYGQVTDEKGTPVSEANIEFGWNAIWGSNKSWGQSDQDGKFQLSPRRGKILSVRVDKKGYLSGTKAMGSFEYAAFFEPHFHRPNPKAPVKFTLIKKLPTEPLYVEKKPIRNLYYDDTPHFLSLTPPTRGQQNKDKIGLQFTFNRSFSSQGESFDYSVLIKGKKIQFQETDKEFPQLAPLDGYKESYQIKRLQEDQQQIREYQVNKLKFFYRDVYNRYGVVSIEITHPNLRSLGARIFYRNLFNPSGSRVLSYDPRKEIR